VRNGHQRPMPHSFLKWAGGKSQLEDEILQHLPATIDTYFEPFFGGGAVFFALARQGRFKRAVISDVNRELIDTLTAIRDDVESVITELEILDPGVVSEPLFNLVKFANCSNHTEVAARMIYLNKTCFNGLYRVNQSGEFNTSWGKHKSFDPDYENLRAVSKALQGVSIIHSGFEIIKMARPGDAVYCDPPYVPVSKTSNFTAYSRDGFTLEDQAQLAGLCALLASEGVSVVASNSDTNQTRAIYESFCGFKTIEVSARRNVNCKGSKRGKVGELLFVSKRISAAIAAE
jgi:DNA adenine methylase